MRRITDPAVPAGMSTAVPDGVFPLSFDRDVFSVPADGSGIFAEKQSSGGSQMENVILRWDGSVVAAAGTEPQVATGQLRLLGSTGGHLGFVCGDAPVGSHCGYEVDGIPKPVSIMIGGKDATSAAWTSAGDAVIAMDAKGHVIRWTPSGTTAIGTVPTAKHIVGVTTDAVYLASDSSFSTVTRLPLTGGKTVATPDALFVAVVP